VAVDVASLLGRLDRLERQVAEGVSPAPAAAAAAPAAPRDPATGRAALGGLARTAAPSAPTPAPAPAPDRLELILLMTVNPGFGGQAFIPSVVEKVRRVKALVGDRPIDIEIDGGVTSDTAPLVVAAGANVLVAGSAVFKGGTKDTYAKNIAAIRAAAQGAR
jgi:ribulose-phosphate 3-epimerase